MIVLVVNIGSSSLKLSLHDIGAENEGASVDLYQRKFPPLWEKSSEAPFDDLKSLIACAWRDSNAVIKQSADIEAVGHRIVHGGRDLTASVRITYAVAESIARAGQFAPEHNALELAALNATTALLGEKIPQVAVFDTAFHATLPEEAYTYAGPYEWLSRGVRRYGFHGVSHSYAAHKSAAILSREVTSLRSVTCHLGGGCSLAAVHFGISVDTTMGFTPLEGIPMATRSGSIDPGIIFYLLRLGDNAHDIEQTLNKKSGVAGVSGLSGDMRELLQAVKAGHARAALALDVYVHHLAQGIASMAASMNGLDALVFTGGVGEHAAAVRAAVCLRLSFLGVHVDEAANNACKGDEIISQTTRSIPVVVVTAEENLMIARDAARVVRESNGGTK
jgi:acetate kinase